MKSTQDILRHAAWVVVALVASGCSGSTEFTPTPGTGGSGGADAAVGGSGGVAGTGGATGGSGGATGGSGGATGGAAGTGPGWEWCAGPGWCVESFNGCCAGCGTQKITDLTGVNQDPAQQAAFRASQCSDPNPACPGCVEQIDPNLAAFCVGQQCQMIDVRSNDVSVCAMDSDCVLRYPECCEECGGPQPDMLIAINKDQTATYQKQVCDPSSGNACPPCVPVYPADWNAYCGADQHCHAAQHQQQGGCPADPPTSSSCSQNGQLCEWGDDIRIECRQNGACSAGVWQIKPTPSCPPLPGAGEMGCPTDMGVTGTSCAGLEGTICDMYKFGKGAMCVCDPCSGGGPCTQYGRWTCTQPPSACPEVAPELGQYCSPPGQMCVYGVCGTKTSAARACIATSLWADQPVACPE